MTMDSTKPDGSEPVAGPVDQPVRPSLAEALESYWDAAYAEGAEGRSHDTEDRRADSALKAVMMVVADLLNAERAAERERCANLCKAYAMRYSKQDDNTKAQAWMMLQCAAEILRA